ncbi:MAG: NHLP bacteriocin system secretion protein [Candidatus Spyradosoma sp.]
MNDKIQFSQKALENLENGSRTHTLTTVKTRWTWFLFGSITLFFAALIAWGFYGSMVESVSGTGITLLENGVHPVTAKSTGQLTHLNIRPGAVVHAEQPVGQVYDAETLFNIRKLETEYNLLSSEVQFLKEGLERLTARKLDADKDKAKVLDALTRLQEDSRSRAKDVAEIYSRLLQKEAATKIEYYQALDQKAQAESSFASTLFQAMDNDVTQEDLIWQQEQRLLELRQQLEQKKRDLDLAHKLYREAALVTADFDGTVLEVFKEEGAYVQKGERLALVASDGSRGIYLVGFIPATRGKEIRNGMSAYFAPAAAPAAQFGYLKCVVREVTSAPVNSEAVQAELMNSTLTKMISGQEAVIRVVLEIMPDSKSESGFRWTTRNGYPGKIRNGMLGTVIVNTSYRSPASYVIPAIREWLFETNTEE